MCGTDPAARPASSRGSTRVPISGISGWIPWWGFLGFVWYFTASYAIRYIKDPSLQRMRFDTDTVRDIISDALTRAYTVEALRSQVVIYIGSLHDALIVLLRDSAHDEDTDGSKADGFDPSARSLTRLIIETEKKLPEVW